MRSQRHYHGSWRDAPNKRSSERDVFNETLPQQSSRRETPERRASRLPLPSVRPLNPGPPRSSSRGSSTYRLGPLQETKFYAAGVSPARRRTASVASSHRSNASLAPSSLRYLGQTPVAQASPLSVLGAREAASSSRRPPIFHAASETPPRFQLRSSSPAVSSSSTVRASPVRRVSEGRPPSLHPLLKQALLLVATAEVEDRLAIQQENTDAFDDLMALFSVAKEVEAIRVAAFDMFELEAKARRALYAQQKRERHVLWYWYLESLNNAMLSREVRALQLARARAPLRQSESLLRSRSASLQPSSYDLFQQQAVQPASPKPAQVKAPARRTQDTPRSLPLSSPKRQLSYPTGNSPRDASIPGHRVSKPRASPSSSSYSYSVSTASSPSRMGRSTSHSLESVYVTGEQLTPSLRGYAAASESVLDDRIARQQLLLASGEPSHSSHTSLLFPKRSSARGMLRK